MATTDELLILQTGPSLIGAQLSYFLFGCFVVQLYNYALASDNDKRSLKIFVTIVAILECIGVGMISDAVWFKLVSSPSGQIAQVPVSFGASTVVGSLLGTCMHGFFAWRVYSMSSNMFDVGAAVLAVLLSAVQLSSALAAVIMFNILNNDQTYTADFGSTIGTHLAGSVACDAVISGAMIIMLHRYRTMTAVNSTKSLLANLIANTIETGALTTVFAILNLIFFLLRPNDAIHNVFHWVLGRIYANVILAALNNRTRLRALAAAGDTTMGEPQDFRFTSRLDSALGPSEPSTGHSDSDGRRAPSSRSLKFVSIADQGLSSDGHTSHTPIALSTLPMASSKEETV